MKKKQARKTVCLLLSAIMMLTGGCAGNSAKKENFQDKSEETQMGRYVEAERDLSEVLKNVSGMKRFSDGSIRIVDKASGIQVSKDNGDTWEKESNGWLDDKLEAAYLMDVQIREDGTIGVIYEDYEKDSAKEDSEEDSAFNLSPDCALIAPDGRVTPVQLSVSEEEMYANRIWLSDQGRIFITTLGDVIYEVSEDGSSKPFLTLEGRPGQIQFGGNLMLIDGYDFKTPLLYDLEKEEYVEEEGLEEFVSSQYGEDRNFNGGSWYDLLYFFGEDGTLYFAGEKGLHRHVIGEKETEQLIDGSLSRLGSPQYGIKGMTLLGDGAFLAVFNNGKLVKFTFDPNVSAYPSEKLKVYSLTESYSLRTAISIYQVMNPDVLVEYEIGMEEDDGITREDALKKLNTEILAGKGPDLLLLDGLPMDSYVEKGLLLKLDDLLETLSKEEELYDNLFLTFSGKEGKEKGIYAVPGNVCFPLMLGREKYVSQMTDLTAVADMVEQLRGDNPGEDLLGICSAKGIMKVFSMASESAWVGEQGEIDREAVSEFLTQMKRIYQAQMDGISSKSIDRYESSTDWYGEIYGENWVYESSIYGINTLDYVGGYTRFMAGITTYPYGYFDITSAAKAEGFEDTLLMPLAGQREGIFIPDSILGINAGTDRKELAEDFVKVFLGEEVQCALGGFAVNKGAFEKLLLPEEEYLGENNLYGSMAMIDEDGIEVDLDVYYPEDEELADLRRWMESADTPLLADLTLEKTVFDEGEAYLEGEQELEETLDAIWSKLAIYMSE